MDVSMLSVLLFRIYHKQSSSTNAHESYNGGRGEQDHDNTEHDANLYSTCHLLTTKHHWNMHMQF